MSPLVVFRSCQGPANGLEEPHADHLSLTAAQISATSLAARSPTAINTPRERPALPRVGGMQPMHAVMARLMSEYGLLAHARPSDLSSAGPPPCRESATRHRACSSVER